MPIYLWSGKNLAGMEEVDRVTAETPEAARKVLEDRGWTDLRQHTSEIHDFVRRDRRRSSGRDLQMTPKEELAYRKGTAPGFWAVWSESLSETMGLALGIAILMIWAILHGSRGGMIWAGVLFLVLLYYFFQFPVLRWWFKQTGRVFQQLHHARTWQQWPEVLKCLDRLDRAQQNTKIGIGDASKARYRALALAGTGRLAEGLEVLRASLDQCKTPPWLHHAHEASLYRIVKQYDKALELYRQALAEATDKSIILIELAAFHVEKYNRPADARELLGQAERLQLSETVKAFLPIVRGKIAWREKDFAGADKHLREALADYSSRPAKKHYLYEANILTLKSYLAVCNAALGNKDVARNYFKEAEPYMKTVGLDELLAEYEALMGKG